MTTDETPDETSTRTPAHGTGPAGPARAADSPAEPPAWRRRLAGAARGAAGQATAEYALVMLAAAGLAGLLLAWATSTDGVGRLMDAVLDAVIGDVQG